MNTLQELSRQHIKIFFSFFAGMCSTERFHAFYIGSVMYTSLIISLLSLTKEMHLPGNMFQNIHLVPSSPFLDHS